jgi:hypothetical protein
MHGRDGHKMAQFTQKCHSISSFVSEPTGSSGRTSKRTRYISSETSISVYGTAQCHNSENSRLLHAFVLSTSTTFSRIPFQSYILSNDMSRPMFNAISHGQHAQIDNRKPLPFYSVLHFTYRHQNNITTPRTHDNVKEKTARSVVT